MLLFLHLGSLHRDDESIFLSKLTRLDTYGLLFLAPSMICLIFALQWGGTTYAWSAPRMIGLLITFAVTFVAFLVVEVLTPQTAMAPMRVVLNRSVAGSMLFMFLISGSMMVVVYYLAIWFQTAQDQSAMDAGIRTIPLVLSLVVFGIIVAVLTQKIGYYVPALLFAPTPCAVGGGMLSTLTIHAGSNHWIGYQVLYGIGIGAGFQTSNLAAQTVLPHADVPLGMALMFFMQQLGGSIFLSVGQNIFVTQLVDGLSGITGLDMKDIIGAGATDLRSTVPTNELGPVLVAYNHALIRVFVLAAALGACTILGALLVEWKSIKGKPRGRGPGQGEPEAQK